MYPRKNIFCFLLIGPISSCPYCISVLFQIQTMYFFYFNKKSLLCNYCFLYFYDWIFTFTLVFSDAYAKNAKSRSGTG